MTKRCFDCDKSEKEVGKLIIYARGEYPAEDLEICKACAKKRDQGKARQRREAKKNEIEQIKKDNKKLKRELNDLELYVLKLEDERELLEEGLALAEKLIETMKPSDSQIVDELKTDILEIKESILSFKDDPPCHIIYKTRVKESPSEVILVEARETPKGIRYFNLKTGKIVPESLVKEGTAGSQGVG